MGETGCVLLTDINAAMLAHRPPPLVDAGEADNIQYAAGGRGDNCRSQLAAFHCVTIGFGLRNVTRKEAALASMYRVLKPGGRLLVLEFSHPTAPGLKPLYDSYSFHVLPWLGK